MKIPNLLEVAKAATEREAARLTEGNSEKLTEYASAIYEQLRTLMDYRGWPSDPPTYNLFVGGISVYVRGGSEMLSFELRMLDGSVSMQFQGAVRRGEDEIVKALTSYAEKVGFRVASCKLPHLDKA